MDSAKYGTNIHEKASPKNFVVLVSTCVTIMTLLYILFHELFFNVLQLTALHQYNFVYSTQIIHTPEQY